MTKNSSNTYWIERTQKSHEKIARKTEKDIQKELRTYYRMVINKVLDDFEATYDKILAAKNKGEDPTPADLYKLDKYWQMKTQLKEELQKLGDKQIVVLTNAFENQWEETYESTMLPSDKIFHTVVADSAMAMIGTAWAPDNKTFSARVWKNLERLAETLDENLVHCVVTGKSTKELRDLLKQRFAVSYSTANRLIRTEIAHIQTQAAAEKYKDYGILYYKFFADTDDRTCRENHSGKSCHELDGKIFKYTEMKAGVNAPPMHPNCRCVIVPVVDDEATRQERLRQIEKHYPEKLAKQKLNLTKGWKDTLNRGYVDGLTENTIKRAAGFTTHYAQMKWIEDKIKENEVLAETYTLLDFTFCIDCGKPIPLDGKKTNAVKRCPDCQAEYRKRYKAEKERERRRKKKQNKK